MALGVRHARRGFGVTAFDGDPGSMLDTLASNARTALDDPGALPEPIGDQFAYVIARMDEIIGLLNPADETRETFADTLTILGRHLAERADVMESVDADVESGERAAYVNAAALVHRALDVLDEAIAELRPDDPEPDAEPAKRLEYLRGELRAERISWGELHELQSLAEYIEPGDVELLEAAGVPEFPDDAEAVEQHRANAREEGIPERDALEGIPHEGER